MKKIIVLLMLITLVISITACSSSGLVGTWEVENSEELEALGLDLSITFTEDEMTMVGVTFPYTTDKDQLIINMMGQEDIIGFKVSGDELTLTLDGQEQVFNRVVE